MTGSYWDWLPEELQKLILRLAERDAIFKSDVRLIVALGYRQKDVEKAMEENDGDAVNALFDLGRAARKRALNGV
tara:strand:- start:318 stop:542 length:225 start_codon:yes stop_codon:yes gene_type:complete